jgi:hypothetical protein
MVQADPQKKTKTEEETKLEDKELYECTFNIRMHLELLSTVFDELNNQKDL